MDEIELRSENIRRVIGPMPKGLFIGGAIITLLIVVALALALWGLPNPNDGNEKLFHLIIKSLDL
ncbi:MAG: hypothetical protein Q4F50_06130 [Bacteroides sp.]|uniref:hypothetical protein n=1 Tax=Bacteroides sp. TaxID=29523 RepID=UPI0026DF85A2|nr:hypothetical protein [Bacteroides sp.]MDO5419622.1 hypothetical protein [Bacteroides sp.]